MAAPTEVPFLGYGTGSTILSGATISSIVFVETVPGGGAITQYNFSGSPDLSSAIAGHEIQASGCANDVHDGTIRITAVNNALKWVQAYNPDVTSSGDNEPTSTGSANILANAARNKKPSLSKRALGSRSPEKPSDAHDNWWKNLVSEWIDYFANGGAVVIYNNEAELRAVDTTGRTAPTAVLVNNLGPYIFDPSGTGDDDSPRCIKPDTGPGMWMLLENFEFNDSTGLAEVDSSFENSIEDIEVEIQQPAKQQYQYTISRSGQSVSATSSALVYFDIYETGIAFGHGDILDIQPPQWFRGELLQLKPFWRTRNTAVAHFYNPTGGAIDLPGGEWKINIIRGNQDA